MKLSIAIGGVSAVSRLDTSPLLARLSREIERELQASATSQAVPDTAAHRDALVRAVGRVQAWRGAS